MTRYADRFPIWVTFNEPNVAYSYASTTNILLSHADAYHWYKEELKGTGRTAPKLLDFMPIPEDSTNPGDIAAAFRCQDFLIGLWANPIYLGEQQYPDSVLSTPGARRGGALPTATSSAPCPTSTSSPAGVLRAAHEDGVSVVGAPARTLATDNNERGAYDDHMGMQTVDGTDGPSDMTYKRSFFDFVEFLQEHVASS